MIPLDVKKMPLAEGLLPELSAASADPNQVVLFWLGQAGFAIRWRERLLIIDPYLSDFLAAKYKGREFPHVRMMAPPAAPETLRGVDLLLCTHRHSDHMDPGTLPSIANASPSCRFVVPSAEIGHAVSIGLPADRLHGMAAGETWEPFEGVRVEAIPSAHESLAVNDKGEHLFLGYILGLGGMRLYHSGDCIPYAGLAGTLRDKGVDAALLPINGRSTYLSERGVAGNFTVEEALALCREAEIGLLVCHHFGMFDFNTIDPRETERRIAAAGAKCVSLIPSTGNKYIMWKK